MVFSRIFKRFFGERIDEISAEKHRNDPAWFDTHWDELVESFDDEDDFKYFIRRQFTVLSLPTVEMLEVFHKHNLNIHSLDLVSRFYLTGLSIDLFKWLIDHEIIKKENNLDLCNYLLNVGDKISFEKFKYAFEVGFPFDIKQKIFVKDISVADEIWEYANNSRGLDFKYSLNLQRRKPDFLLDYIEWVHRRNIDEDSIPLFNYRLPEMNIPILETLLRYGYLQRRHFDGKNVSPEVRNWLIAHGFTEYFEPEYERNLVYHSPPVPDIIPDNISVMTEKIN